MDVLARFIPLPRKRVVAEHDHPVDERLRTRARKQQLEQLRIRHQSRVHSRDVQAMTRSARVRRDSVDLLEQDQFGEVGWV